MIKSLHSITFEQCQFSTRVQYNINTNHIVIGITHQWKNPEYAAKWYQENKERCAKDYQETSVKYRQDNKEKISKAGAKYREEHRDPNTSVIGSNEFRIKISCSIQGIPIEEFEGFLTEQKYCPKFNGSCREQNREKYGRECFICGKPESENITSTGKIKKLSVHHIDMNKDQGCDSDWELVPVCVNCHNKLHTKLWESRIKYILNTDI